MLVSVRDIMTENIVAIGPGDSVQDAVGLLLRHGISGLPVIDGNRRLLGLLSEYDALKNLVDGLPANRPVSEYMTREVQTVAPEDNVTSVAERFLGGHHRRFPVVENGRLVGVVSRRDVIRLIETVRSFDDDLKATSAEPAAV